MKASTGDTYLICGTKPWNRRLYNERLCKLPGRWEYFDGSGMAGEWRYMAGAFRYIFFLHWSERIPPEVYERYECVGFHIGDLPMGRGGSPLQNHIAEGGTETRLTAFRITKDLDAGPIYGKLDLPLYGTAEEIFIRAGWLMAYEIERIVKTNPTPEPQSGKGHVYKRRTPEQSEIRKWRGLDYEAQAGSEDPAPVLGGLEALYDFVRMLDAEGYPRAFLRQAGFRFEFSRATLRDGRIVADCTITEEP